MLFKDSKQGYPIYILDKANVKVIQGKVISVSAPRVQPSQMGIYPQTTSLVVDVTMESEGTTKTYTIPETSSLTYAGSLVLSTDKDGILREVQAMKSASEDALAKIGEHRNTLEQCNKVLEELDTTFAEKRKQDERIGSIETEVRSIGRQLRDFIEQFNK